jgi:hypothetical protein
MEKHGKKRRNTTRKTSPFRSKTHEFHCFRHGPW